ncbi:MAG: hypothetical protein MK236_10590, partial [Pedosphaera sp.]|nr:hypothetical protein [Pedosphaera sp.]
AIHSRLATRFAKFTDCRFFWGIHFLVGSMAHTMADSERLRSISSGLCDPDDTEGTIRRLVAFLNGGLKAKTN